MIRGVQLFSLGILAELLVHFFQKAESPAIAESVGCVPTEPTEPTELAEVARRND
jgi:hypothetical protein